MLQATIVPQARVHSFSTPVQWARGLWVERPLRALLHAQHALPVTAFPREAPRQHQTNAQLAITAPLFLPASFKLLAPQATIVQQARVHQLRILVQRARLHWEEQLTKRFKTVSHVQPALALRLEARL